jgi:hypothetical protein
VNAEVSSGVLVAANDRGSGAGANLGIPVDADAVVMVYAATPRGRWVQFAIAASSVSRKVEKAPSWPA